MPQPNTLPKERQLNARSIRRTLASITPSTSNPQLQSPLISLLPPEIRFLIFTHVLSQVPNPSRPISIHSLSPLYRPGHTHHSSISTFLLSTCRLIYFEAQSIPLRSATHHSQYIGRTPLDDTGDSWLYHMSSQHGAHVYHLHDNIVSFATARFFEKFLLPHLRWKRITWTIPAYVWPATLTAHYDLDEVADVLGSVVVPSSCKEVVLELEVRDDLSLNWWKSCMGQAEQCRGMVLKRKDGVELAFDEGLAMEYTWVGSGNMRGVWNVDEGETRPREYRAIRVGWRAPGVKRREYMSYDQMDCLCLDGYPGIEVKPLTWADSSVES